MIELRLVVIGLGFVAVGCAQVFLYSPPPVFLQARLGGGFRGYLEEPGWPPVLYTPPPLLFQARLGGGFRSYLPDSCGVENFEFKAKTNKSDNWFLGGNVTSKTGNHWIFEDSNFPLAPGDHLFYSGAVRNRGNYFPLHPDAEWVVPELVDEFGAPPVENPAICPKEKEPTTTPTTTTTTTTSPTTSPTATSPTTTSPTTPTTTTPTTTTPAPDKKPNCPWVDMEPNETKEQKLENNFGRLQCDLHSFAQKTVKLNDQVTEELTDLKRLLHVMISRMLRLESLMKSIPRGIPRYI